MVLLAPTHRRFAAQIIMHDRRQPRAFSTVPANRVLEITERWIQNVIVQYGLCPYITKGKCKIIVSENDDFDDMTHLLVNNALKLAAEKPTPDWSDVYPSRLIVYPQIDTGAKMEAIYAASLQKADGLIGRLDQFVTKNSQMKVQAQPYMGEQALRDILANTGERHRNTSVPFQSIAPWCTIQLLRYDDLEMARGPDGMKGLPILQNNQRLDQRMGSNENKMQIIHRCRLDETQSQQEK